MTDLPRNKYIKPHEDWIEVTQRLMGDDDIVRNFEGSSSYDYAFQEWASKEYPEEYGND